VRRRRRRLRFRVLGFTLIFSRDKNMLGFHNQSIGKPIYSGTFAKVNEILSTTYADEMSISSPGMRDSSSLTFGKP
jgi:hypothetical protein